MIIKSFEIEKKKISKFKFFVVYGENEGLKNEIINKIKNEQNAEEIKYDETQILKNKSEFFNEIKNKSFFKNKRTFLIERCTNKIEEIVLEICEDNNEDLIIFNCGLLEKKSKLRNHIEKSLVGVIIPCYKDNSQSLANIAKNFFNQRKISISYETINLLASRCNGDRGYLQKELDKVSNYLNDKKIVTQKEIYTLTNLYENYSASELVDATLSKNIKKACEILNENNYTHEDTFLILRVFLQKAKKINNLMENIDGEKNLDEVISKFRPPIFWKDKPIIKKQVQIWSFEKIKLLIFKLNDLEVKIKKNNSLSLVLMKNFIYETLDQKANNYSLLAR